MENGWSEDAMDDIGRIAYMREHLQSVLEAIHIDGCNVTGYTHWTIVDNFEWNNGYT